jgi:hypothetical protein
MKKMRRRERTIEDALQLDCSSDEREREEK